jgi:hypothetical protein
VSSKTSRKPSGRELERRRRQSEGQRRTAARAAMQRNRQRASWKDTTAEALGGSVESARRMLDDDPELSDSLYFEWRCLPEKLRGADPVSVVAGDERHTRGGAEKASSRVAELAAEGLMVVDLERQAEDDARERRFVERLSADLDGLAREAAVMLAANRAVLEWKDMGKGAGGGTLTACTSWLMFDGSYLGTLWPDDLALIQTADYAAALYPAARRCTENGV